MKKIVFITGTRADYGKLKSLMKRVDESNNFEAYIYVSGMHLIEKLGYTYNEILNDNYKNVYVAYGLAGTQEASYNLGDVICNLTGYILNIKPDMIVVHGDRIDALAGAVVGALNNIIVAHIEGGELSGTIDESIRHAISKLAHIHFACNEEAKKRLIQLGEKADRIFVIGSPDIDIMLSDYLPSMDDIKKRYGINYSQYGILMYHPVTTEYNNAHHNIQQVVNAVLNSNLNYVVIYPNNDLGYELILNEYKRFNNNSKFKIFPSLRFEYFLTLLKNAQFMIGNSSAGVRETSIYGVPAIDIGTRQNNRYRLVDSNIQHTNYDEDEILQAILNTDLYKKNSMLFGDGNSTERFMDIISHYDIWSSNLQKTFVDFKF